MIGLKDQCFGVEVEMTGITREQAATMLTRLMEKLIVAFGRPLCGRRLR